jgi:hypothetical protein
LNLQEFRTTTPLAIANNISMGFSKKYASGSLQLAMGKIQTLWPPITDVHQETHSEKKKLAILGVGSKKLELLPMK